MHIHTCLSPCSDWDMSPKKIVQRSLDKGLDVIAICDHNTAENVGAVMKAGENREISVLPGIEICSKEEVHIIALFDKLDSTLAMQDYVYANLTGDNNPEIFGYQVVANEQDEVLGENPRLLIGATQLGIYDIVEKTHSLGGLSLSSHVDRTAYGIIGQLGFIPSDLKIDGVEVSYRVPLDKAVNEVPGIGKLPCMTASDAHFLDDIGKAWTMFVMAKPTTNEIRRALRGKDGRRVKL
ncbi:MAG: PHP-associated domain-containing protein [Desulfobacterales bacterium]